MRARRLIALLLLAASAAPAVAASSLPASDFPSLAISQKLGARLPLDAGLRDESGRVLALGALFGSRPVLLVLGYFRCPNLCGLVRTNMIETLNAVDLLPGRDFEIAVVSLDPRETAADATSAKAADLALYRAPESRAGWHYLTTDQATARRLAEGAGFPFRYDAAIDQFAHPIGLILATPDGVLARYIEGFGTSPRDLRLGLVEASAGALAAPAARLLLLCYGYDPATGRYGILIGKLLRLVGGGTILLLVTVIGIALARERRAAR